MNKKSFFFGFVTGIVLTLVVIIIIAIVSYKSGETDPVHFLDQPVSIRRKHPLKCFKSSKMQHWQQRRLTSLEMK